MPRAQSGRSAYSLAPFGALAGFALLDEQRRRRGRDLEALGFGPVETPWIEAGRWTGVRLRRYGPARARCGALLVPAPIKRPYIWDIEPTRSPVRALIGAGLCPYLVEWTDDLAGGLPDVAGDLLRRSLDAVVADTGGPAVLLGHSLGGTLAAVAAAAHPRAVARLVLLESPLRFGAEAGAFAAYALTAPDLPSDLLGEADRVPGSLLNLFSVAADPASYGIFPMFDAVASAADADLLATHLRVRRWTLDEFAMPARLFRDIVIDLYRDDRFYEGTLAIAGRHVGPDDVGVPILAVVNPLNPDVPPASTVRFLERRSDRSHAVLEYLGERGIALQHVGVLVGRAAHAQLWPRIVSWLQDSTAMRRAQHMSVG